jgi:hypothetical protein
MKGMSKQALDTPRVETEGEPAMGIVVGSLAALALWGAIVGLISLIV